MAFHKECRLELSKYAHFSEERRAKHKKGTGQEERNERKEEINKRRERKKNLPHSYVLTICVL